MAVPKLRFKEFDGDWNSIAIGKFLKIKSGLGFKAEEYSTEQEIRLLQIENVGYGAVKWTHNVKFVPTNYLDVHKDLVLKEGDLVLALNRPVTNDQLKIAKLTQEDSPSILYQRVGKLDFLKEDIDKEFIFQIFKKDVKNYVLNSSIGSDQPFISTTDLYKHKLCIPLKEEQTKIASFLSAVDEKISQLTQKHELLSQYKQGMMQKLFSQQLRFKADDGSEFGEWEEIKLTDFLKFTPRPIEKPNTNYHALGVRSHFKGLFNKFDSEPNKISMDTLYRVKRNDVVVNITFAWEGAMAIAEKEHDEGLVSHRFPTYLCDDSKINLHFFKYRFIQKDFLSALQLCSPGGAGRNRVLNKSAFLEISFSKPTLEEQTKIANFLSAIDQKIEVVAQQIEQAKTWKKGLLQQMFV